MVIVINAWMALMGKKIILQRVKELYPTVMENVSVLCPKMMKYSKGPIVLEFV